jgi:tetratricopeptide (TPR) repeat protein
VDLTTLEHELSLLYVQSESDRIIEFGKEHVEDLYRSSENYLAGSVCRFIMLAHYMNREYEAGDEWWDRAMDHFEKANYPEGIAIMMIPMAYRCLGIGVYIKGIDQNTESGRLDEGIMVSKRLEREAYMILRTAKSILGDIENFRYNNGEYPIFHNLMPRLYYEKSAYVMFRMGEYNRSYDEYKRAIHFANKEPVSDGVSRIRSQYKARGGAALALYYLGEREAALHELRVIVEELESVPYLEEISSTARENIKLFVQNPEHDSAGIKPFEIA